MALVRRGHPRGPPRQAQEYPTCARNPRCRQKADAGSALALVLSASGRLLAAGEAQEAPGTLGPGVLAGSSAKRVLRRGRRGGVGVPAYIMLT